VDPSSSGLEPVPGDHVDTTHPAGTSQVLGRNLRALAFSEVSGKIAGLAMVVVLARFLGRVDFGRYTVAVALISIASSISESGTGTYLVREGARSPHDLGRILGNVLGLRGGLALLTVAVAVPVGAAFGYDHTTLLAVGLFAVASGLRLVGGAFTMSLQALERMGEVAGLRAGVSLAQAVGACVAAAATRSLVAVSWSVLAASALYPVWAWVRLRRHWNGRIERRPGRRLATLKATTPFAIAATMFVALTYLDSLLVRAFDGDAATGLYGAAYRVLLALMLVPTIYNDAVMRSMAHLGANAPDRLRAVYTRAVGHLVLIAMPIAAGGAILSRRLLVDVFGRAYAGASTALALLLITLVMAYPGYVNVTAVYALGLERRLAITLPFVVAFNAGVNLWAIPAFGIKGAAATMLATEALFIVLMTIRLRRSGLSLGRVGWLVKPVVATALMAAVVWPLRNVPVIVPVVAGAVVYLGAIVALRTFGPEDRELWRAVIGRSSGPPPSGA
jgi:O-antigen/teichoic acid export membrane protein